MVKEYNKLIRDNIPNIIKAAGKHGEYRILDSHHEYSEYLIKKLYEEIAEFNENKNIDELADVLEVVYALAKASGSSVENLESIRKAKVHNNGGFEKRIVLIKTTE